MYIQGIFCIILQEMPLFLAKSSIAVNVRLENKILEYRNVFKIKTSYQRGKVRFITIPGFPRYLIYSDIIYGVDFTLLQCLIVNKRILFSNSIIFNIVGKIPITLLHCRGSINSITVLYNVIHSNFIKIVTHTHTYFIHSLLLQINHIEVLQINVKYIFSTL